MVQNLWVGMEAARLGRQIIGREALVQALTSFLCSHAEKTTEPMDLDDVLEDVRVSSNLRLGSIAARHHDRAAAQPLAPQPAIPTAQQALTPLPALSPQPSLASATDLTAQHRTEPQQ